MSSSINLRLSSQGYLALQFLREDIRYLSKSFGIYVAHVSLSEAIDILSTWETYEGMHEDLDPPESDWFKRFDIDIRVLRSQIDRCKRVEGRYSKSTSKVEPSSVNVKRSPSKSHTKPKPTHSSPTVKSVKSYYPKLEDFEYDPRVYEIGKLNTLELRRKKLVEVVFDKVKDDVLERNKDKVIELIKSSLPPISTHKLNGYGEIAVQLSRAERVAAAAGRGT